MGNVMGRWEMGNGQGELNSVFVIWGDSYLVLTFMLLLHFHVKHSLHGQRSETLLS